MILNAFQGFCMALADSVPGVSGGTIAFILGFYENFLEALHDLSRGKGEERRSAIIYLLKLGSGWVIGMAACVLALSSLFEKNIYFMSSLFLGFTVCSITFIAVAERKTLKRSLRFGWLVIPSVLAVVCLTMMRAGTGTLGNINYAQLQPLQFAYIFFTGAVAVTAMVLPGISGSSVLLIAGIYLPTIQAVHGFMSFQPDVLPGLCILGMGVIAGVGFSIHAIRNALRKYRGQMVWLIIGLMSGSLYAIVNGPSSLDRPLPALDTGSFSFSAFMLGVIILLALEFIKKILSIDSR